jgi:hypothetical protein
MTISRAYIGFRFTIRVESSWSILPVVIVVRAVRMPRRNRVRAVEEFQKLSGAGDGHAQELVRGTKVIV